MGDKVSKIQIAIVIISMITVILNLITLGILIK